MKLRCSARTDIGRAREHNEDSYGIGDGEQGERLGALLIVCDGMGGHAAGEVASRLGVDAILESYYSNPAAERADALEQSFRHANTRIYESGRGSMGTTGVAALLYHNALLVANVGDSRAYLLRGGQLHQVSRDHSFVNDQVAAGLLTPEQARVSPHRNVITRALGHQSVVDVDLFRVPLLVDDMVLLSSDGLHGLLGDDEIARIIASYPIDQAVERLIDLANARGGSDNITVVLAKIDTLDPPPEQPAPPSPAATSATSTTTGSRPTTGRLVPGAEQLPISSAAKPAPAAPAPPAPRAPVPAPTERRLSLLGGLLAALLLTVLLFVILINLPAAASYGEPPAATAPLATSSPATRPASTAVLPTTLASTAVPAATLDE